MDEVDAPNEVWMAFVLVLLAGSVYAVLGAFAPAGVPDAVVLWTRIGAVVFFVLGGACAHRSYTARRILGGLVDHAMATCLLLMAGWDVVLPLLVRADAATALVHVVGGGSVFLLVALALRTSSALQAPAPGATSDAPYAPKQFRSRQRRLPPSY